MQPSLKSDIYALGATVHHLLTAHDPRDRFTSFPELDLEILRSLSRFQPLAEARPDISPALASLVGRCLDPTRLAGPVPAS
jgi:serine/threonine protein kinase